MPLRSQFAAQLATRFVLLFVALAVFSSGVQVKVSLYRAHQSPVTVAAAKILTEDRSTDVKKSVKAFSEHAGSILNISSESTYRIILYPDFRYRRPQVKRHRPSGCDVRSIDLMRRPPPSRA